MNKQQLLNIYAKSDKVASAKREKLFLQQQKIGMIDKDAIYSDETYADLIGIPFATLPSPEVANQYLNNIFNKLALIEFITIAGSRNELFTRGLKDYVPYGDTAELIYTDLRDTQGYDITKFIPDATTGGNIVYSQRITLSDIEDTTNPDRRMLDVVVPTLLISQALNGAIQTGLANGWPTIFDEQLERSWERFKFDRMRNLLALSGGTPNNNKWMESTTTFTPNDAQFIEITNPVTDAQTFQDLLIQIYNTSAQMEGEYLNTFNPANITQITPIAQQGLFLDSDYEAYFRTTNAIIYNSENINVKQVYNTVDFLKLLPSKVKPEAIKVKAILYSQYPFLHYPFTNGTYRGTQIFERNRTTAIYDHFWLASGIDLSKPIIVFYEATTTKKGK